MASKDSIENYIFLPPSPHMLDITERKFGRLTVIGMVGQNKRLKAIWLCKCKCGAVKEVGSSSLVQGKVESCGCLQRERASQANATHGMSKSREYKIYAGIKKRCYNTNSTMYQYYGGRGITVCASWRKSFENFYADMGPCPDGYSIDRKNNNGNYTPSNCRWTDRHTQANNKRNTVIISYRGISLTLSQWARELGISYLILFKRINMYGWPVSKALTTPAKVSNRVLRHKGVGLTLSQWSGKTGISYRTLTARINILGWSTAKALTTPVKKRKTSCQ